MFDTATCLFVAGGFFGCGMLGSYLLDRKNPDYISAFVTTVGLMLVWMFLAVGMAALGGGGVLVHDLANRTSRPGAEAFGHWMGFAICAIGYLSFVGRSAYLEAKHPVALPVISKEETPFAVIRIEEGGRKAPARPHIPPSRH